MGYRHPVLLMLAMHVPLPAIVIPWLAHADGLWLLPGGLLAFVLVVRAIADLWTSDAVDDERRPVWIAALVLLAPLALPAYWWRNVRPRAPDYVASPTRRRTR